MLLEIYRMLQAPGPDGLCSKFYKEFCDLLADPPLHMFNLSLLYDGLPQTQRQISERGEN